MAITGLAEEPIFRGLLVGILVVVIPARMRVGRVDLPRSRASCLAHLRGCAWRSFLHDLLGMAIAQQTYAIIWGLTYVWLMERSRSLLAPVIAHGLGDAVEVGLAILWRFSFGT